MSEAIRLIIWDLDETFWSGTLSEGGITYNQTNHDMVIELAKRGIMSTICSKNNFDAVHAVLAEKGIWEYFVFPSINWNPKGPRLKALVEDVQLRPETIMLIDDNQLNLNEAKHFVPGLQTADEKFIPEILDSPLFKGKDDRKLSRLNQYKLLEKRRADESVAEDNVEFLRSCNIRVEIDLDVEKNIDRAIELINRTNQLNFTKKRLPEEPEKARAKLRDTLDRIGTQTALIRVTDRYGDYGYCGFYLARTKRGQTRLVQYCFSCRILNMGVENWLYEKLGRPEIRIVGEVLTDLSKPLNVDWINVQGSGQSDKIGKTPVGPRVIIRGACSVSPLAHYFAMESPEIVGEFNDIRNSVMVRRDHTLMLRYAIEGISSKEMDILRPLGFIESDFETKFTDTRDEPALRLLSNWVDSQDMIWRHKQTGFLVPYKLKRKKSDKGWEDEEESQGDEPHGNVGDFESYLQENFEFLGELPEEEAAKNFDAILGALPPGSPLFIISAPDTKPGKKKSATTWAIELNRRTAAAVARHPDKLVLPVAIADLADEDERQTIAHFDRKVYFRLYQHLSAKFRELCSSPESTEQNVAASSAAQPGELREVETVAAE